MLFFAKRVGGDILEECLILFMMAINMPHEGKNAENIIPS